MVLSVAFVCHVYGLVCTFLLLFKLNDPDSGLQHKSVDTKSIQSIAAAD